MKKLFFILVVLSLPLMGIYSQRVTLKSNLLYWGTTTPNAGMEFSISRHFTFDVWGAYNAWKFGSDMKLNLYLVQPEFRYWPCQKFEGHFIGAHGHYGHFNIGMIPFIPELKDKIYRGDLYGAGISYGYHWAVGERWGIEATIGAGYVYMDYDKYRCVDCAELIGSYKRSYFGPTRLGLSFIYFIR